MTQKKGNIIRSFAGLIFGLVTVMGIFFIGITYTVITHYHDAGTQLLNKEVAAHIAKFASPFEGGGIDQSKADSVFYNAMVLSPSAEVYFLDTAGNLIAYHEDDIPVRERKIALAPIQSYILSKGEKYIKGQDPRDPSHDKIFSAAEVLKADHSAGFIYVILNSKKSEGIMDLVFGNHILNLAIISFLAVIGLSLVFSLLYLRRISRNYRKLITVLERFEDGDYSARFNFNKSNELEPVTRAFNRMADLLSASIDRLKNSEQERKNFIATISHDLRTPLAIARGYAETLLIKKDAPDPGIQDREYYSGLIHDNLLRIENMVKQLFELSKMDAVEFKPAKEPFVLSEIVQEAVNSFQLVASEKNIDLRCTECFFHVWVNADVSMMERVIQNLIVNAIKSTPAGGSITLAPAPGEKELVFSIQNTSDPLPQELADWVNNSFDTDSLLSRRPAAAGLGLLIVQRILHLHGSALHVSSDAGATCFSFSLPIYMKISD